MNRLAVALVAALSGACVADNTTIYILQNQVIGANCTVSGDIHAVGLTEGRLDVTEPVPGFGFPNPGYTFGPVVVNSAVAPTTMPNLHIVFLNGGDVELRAGPSTRSQDIINSLVAANDNKRTVRFSASVTPGGSAGVPYDIIDGEQTQRINGLIGETESIQLIAHTTVFGTIDGGDIVSAPFDYPVTVCKGCLWGSLGPCSAIPKGTAISKGGPCNPIQDVGLTCCADPTDNLICPAVAPQ
jgi:hypothetical protein